MGRRNGFDKKNSVTYSLIHTSAPAGEQSQRLWVEKSRGVGVGRPDPEEAAEASSAGDASLSPGHPLSFLGQEAATHLTDEERKQLVDLGLPDDGYNYLKHLRDPVSLAGPVTSDEPNSALLEGSAIFMPAQQAQAPPDDLKVFQSFQLQLPRAAHSEAEAAKALSGVSAYSHEAGNIWNKYQDELADLRKAMLLAEGAQDSSDSADGLLDDFLLSATQDALGHPAEAVRLEQEAVAAQPPAMPTSASSEAWEEGSAASDHSSDSVTDLRSLVGPELAAGPGSIASTYWRPERADRNQHLSAIDERFDQLALGYNSDEFGELGGSDGGGDKRLDVKQFGSVLDDFLAMHATHDHAHEGGQAYSVPAEQPNGLAADQLEAAVTVARAREYGRMAEQRAEATPDRDVHHWEDEVPRERWDCESVLTSLSNLDNHPGKIMEPGSLRRPRHSLQQQQQQIHLSARSGLPVRPDRGGERAGGEQPESTQLHQSVGVQLRKQPQHRHGETAEQKRERKAASKEARRRARANKKELKVMFKDEAKRHQQPGTAASTIPMR